MFLVTQHEVLEHVTRMLTTERHMVSPTSSPSGVLGSLASAAFGALMQKRFLRPTFDLLVQEPLRGDPEVWH